MRPTGMRLPTPASIPPAVMPISMNIMNVGYALTAAFGGVLSCWPGSSWAPFTLYLGYCRQVGQPLSQISQQLTTILPALAGVRAHL